jgi:catechol 2,3-dioxygenase-like lactoylglutathione lyase family enzyme
MLRDAKVQPMLPVKDLNAAEKFYEGTLGFRKVDGAPGAAAVYQSGDGIFSVYQSQFAGTNQGTAALWTVENVEKEVEELKGKGVTFEHYDDLPGLTRKGDVHHAGEITVAWFKDPDGNILSVQNRPAKA